VCSTHEIGAYCVWPTDCNSGHCDSWHHVCSTGDPGSSCAFDNNCSSGHCSCGQNMQCRGTCL
jgi:hypothetical protein